MESSVIFLERLREPHESAYPVNRDEIDSAVTAFVKKLDHPLAAIIGYRRGTKSGLSSERLHVLAVCVRGGRGVEVRLARILGLVEGKEVLGAGSNPGRSMSLPCTSVVRGVTPKHGNVFCKLLLVGGV